MTDPRVWLSVLEPRLSAREPQMRTFDDYYTGNHPLPFITPAHLDKLRNEFRQMLDESRSNFCRLVVDAVEERLKVDGFRLSASSDARADKESWDIWQANNMDSESSVAFVDAVTKGVSYLSVWAGDDHPTIAVEDPAQTIVAYEPGSGFRRRSAALKIWQDDASGMDRANVYVPDGIYKYERRTVDSDPVTSDLLTASGSVVRGGSRRTQLPSQSPAWVELPDLFVANPVGVVPIVPLRNRPRVLVEGESELADVFRVQNQINGFLFLLALAGYFGAHRQRWMTGVTLNKDENGKAVEPFRTAIDRLWFSEEKEARFGDFEQTDLSGYIAAIEQKVNHIAVTTRTPRHYLLPEGQEPSGDSIKSAEAGLIKKIQRKQAHFGEGLEEAIRLARMFGGADDAPADSEVVWADPQIRTEAEITDATIKKYQAQLISREQALEDLGYSPQQIGRMMAVPPDTAEVATV